MPDDLARMGKRGDAVHRPFAEMFFLLGPDGCDLDNDF